jgi:predicted secreted hydrolase
VARAEVERLKRLVDRVITRDTTKLTPGRVFYTPWCDEHGKVIDDGTIHGLDDGTFRWTAADPQLRWLRMNSAGLDVAIDPILRDQELTTERSTGVTYWEGACRVRGTARGRPVSGRAYAELTGYAGRDVPGSD